MTTKAAKSLVDAANAAVDRLSVDEAALLAGQDGMVFVDVREPAEWQAGHVPGAVHVPRGLLEFKADPSLPAAHEKALDPAKKLVVYCASGGRSALAAKTLKDMGYPDVVNMTGGFGTWSQAGKPVEC
jgi:rhodanese-related sulfurtransferase